MLIASVTLAATRSVGAQAEPQTGVSTETGSQTTETAPAPVVDPAAAAQPSETPEATPTSPTQVSAADASTPSERGAVDAFADMSLNDLLNVVVTATKQEQSIEEAPSIIEVITARDIRRAGYRTVGEALRSVPGMAVIDDYLYYNVGVRGLYAEPGAASDIIKLMINGQSVSFRSFSGNVFGHDLVPIEAVRQIEIIRGPGSALYGANAFLGVINIVTFDGSEQGEAHPDNRVVADGYYTNHDSVQKLNGGGSALATWSQGDFSGLLAATFNYGDRSGLHIPGEDDIAAYPNDKGYPTPGWDRATRERLLANSPSKSDLERVGKQHVRNRHLQAQHA